MLTFINEIDPNKILQATLLFFMLRKVTMAAIVGILQIIYEILLLANHHQNIIIRRTSKIMVKVTLAMLEILKK